MTPESPPKDQWLRKLSPLNYESLCQVLRHFNLTPGEIRGYLFLATNGPHTPAEVSRALENHRTEAYKICRNLENKGLVERTFDRPMRFSALDFNEALNLLISDRERVMKDMQMLRGAMVEALSQVPRHDININRKCTFSFPNEAYVTLIANTIKRNEGLYYVTEEAFRNLYNYLPPSTPINTQYPALGSFLVFDDAVFLLEQEDSESWRCAKVTAPNIVKAYKLLQSYLVPIHEVPAHV